MMIVKPKFGEVIYPGDEAQRIKDFFEDFVLIGLDK